MRGVTFKLGVLAVLVLCMLNFMPSTQHDELNDIERKVKEMNSAFKSLENQISEVPSALQIPVRASRVQMPAREVRTPCPRVAV